MKYQQGKMLLKKINGDKISYCCLGVACEIFKEECELEEKIYHDISYFDNNHTSLSDTMRQYIGISKTFQEILIDMNDIEDKSFYQIASIIEESNPT